MDKSLLELYLKDDDIRGAIHAVVGWVMGFCIGVVALVLMIFDIAPSLSVLLIGAAWVILVWAFGALAKACHSVIKDI